MAIKLASWNVGRRLSSEKHAGNVIEGLKRLDADVVVLPESYSKSSIPTDKASEAMIALGYQRRTLEYQDALPHPSERQYMTVLSRIAGTAVEATMLKTRRAFALSLVDPESKQETRGIGAHYDDRTEALRIGMAEATIALDPDFVIGDINSAEGPNNISRLVAGARHIPHPRARSLGGRLHDMQQGGARRVLGSELQAVGNGELTKSLVAGRVGVAALDALYVNPARLDVADYAVHTAIRASDHWPISASIQPVQS